MEINSFNTIANVISRQTTLLTQAVGLAHVETVAGEEPMTHQYTLQGEGNLPTRLQELIWISYMEPILIF